MIGGKVGGLALFLLHLKHTDDQLRAAAQKRVEEEAQRVVEEMQSRVPSDSGAARESIRWEAKPGGGVRILAGDESTVKDGYNYVRAIEFGRPPSQSGPGQPMRPFFRPVIDETSRQGRDRITRGIVQDMQE